MVRFLKFVDRLDDNGTVVASEVAPSRSAVLTVEVPVEFEWQYTFGCYQCEAGTGSITRRSEVLCVTRKRELL